MRACTVKLKCMRKEGKEKSMMYTKIPERECGHKVGSQRGSCTVRETSSDDT